MTLSYKSGRPCRKLAVYRATVHCHERKMVLASLAVQFLLKRPPCFRRFDRPLFCWLQLVTVHFEHLFRGQIWYNQFTTISMTISWYSIGKNKKLSLHNNESRPLVVGFKLEKHFPILFISFWDASHWLSYAFKSNLSSSGMWGKKIFISMSMSCTQTYLSADLWNRPNPSQEIAFNVFKICHLVIFGPSAWCSYAELWPPMLFVMISM